MEKKSSSTWSVIIKVVIAVASALAGVFGLNSCMKLTIRAGSFYQNYREVKLLVVHCSAVPIHKI